jgi:chlorite dismutase
MPEQTPRTLNHFALYRFKDAYWDLTTDQRQQFHTAWLAGLQEAARRVDVCQTFPAQGQTDILVWSAIPAEETQAGADFFTAYARATNPHRAYLQPDTILWGYTRPSQYTRTRSTQEIDPFAETRQTYLVLYPFVKTIDWYLMSRDARQGMMNEHIRIGKQYPEITQLLLYSFGLQDQEFIVVYETEDLNHFSTLVAELRGSEARRYTLRDTPLHTALYHPAEETLALWR